MRRGRDVRLRLARVELLSLLGIKAHDAITTGIGHIDKAAAGAGVHASRKHLADNFGAKHTFRRRR